MREVVEKTLTGMANGGIRDHVGGGFHRYSVDERWIVPHFEKMAYDNAELLHAYLNGYSGLGNPLFREVAGGIVDWRSEERRVGKECRARGSAHCERKEHN